MKVRYSFSSRRTRHIKKISKQKEEYPEILKTVIAMSDIVLEILDARFPEETRNREIEKLIKSKKKELILVANKSDISEKEIPIEVLRTSCKERKGIADLRTRIKIEAKKISKPVDERGKITVGVIGYPNTGKSSLINILIGKSSAGTGHEAGFTKGIQKLKLTSEILLLDSPGVIPRRQYSSIDKKLISQQTKLGGRSYEQVKEPELVVARLVSEFPDVLEKFYKIKADGDSEILIEKLGRKKGLLKKGNKVNEDQTARVILKDWQEGKIKF